MRQHTCRRKRRRRSKTAQRDERGQRAVGRVETGSIEREGAREGIERLLVAREPRERDRFVAQQHGVGGEKRDGAVVILDRLARRGRARAARGRDWRERRAWSGARASARAIGVDGVRRRVRAICSATP